MISLKESKNYNGCISLLNNIINNCENSYIKKEAYQLKIKLNKNIEPDIFILNYNPLNNNFSVLNSGIFAYLNNQYYLLQKIYEKVKSNIKIKSIVLNKNNLEESLSKEGKILIIQSDDFSKKGEIILESDIGQSQILSIDEDGENKSTFNLLLPEKIKFKIVILCFINSSKLIDKFKDKVEYLITFDEINFFDLDDDVLLKYNELSIDFLIDFIEKTTKNNIKESFEYSKAQFISKLNEYKDLKINNFIALTKQIDNGKNIENIKYENNIYKDGKGEKIFLYYPFPDLPFNNLRNKDYADEIFDLMQQILSQKQDLINVYLNNDKRKKIGNLEKIIDKKALISVEIMRFLYRHQSYSKLYYIFNPKKYGIDLKEISENKIFENLKSDEEFECSNKAFILINNFDKIKSYKYIRRPIYLLDNLQYLVMTKKEIIININEDKDYNESDRKYKNKILVKDSKYKVISKSLIPEKII